MFYTQNEVHNLPANAHCPLILDYVHCEDPEARSCAGLRDLMRLAVQLSREELDRGLDILRTSGLEQDDPLRTKKKRKSQFCASSNDFCLGIRIA